MGSAIFKNQIEKNELSEAFSFTLLDNCSFIVRSFFKLSNRASAFKNNNIVSNF